jgi:hypothetical protein
VLPGQLGTLGVFTQDVQVARIYDEVHDHNGTAMGKAIGELNGEEVPEKRRLRNRRFSGGRLPASPQRAAGSIQPAI